MGFSFDPAVMLAIGTAIGLYIRAVRVLRGRGYDVPRHQQFCFYLGVTLAAVALLSPIDGKSEEFLTFHMAQHLLIADIAAPLLLVGIRSPVYAFLLPKPALIQVARRKRLRAAFRFIRQPLVAIPIFVLLVYGWHFAFAFEAAMNNGFVHVLQHQSFIFAAILVWWTPINPKKRHIEGELWKIGHIMGARLAGMFLGMAFIIARSPIYASTYGKTAPEHGLSAVRDQQYAGGLMMAVDVAVILFALTFFFWRAAADHDRDEQEARAAVNPG